MSYQDIPINISYKSVGEDSFSTILNPLLSCTKVYRRSVGFFSSSALNFIGDGVLTMAKNGGRIFLATSPKLSESDAEAIEQGYNARDIAKGQFVNEVKQTLLSLSDQNAEILYLLIREGILDVKIVLKDGGMYHDKLAVLEDYSGNVVACVGSNNESGSGYHNNYEKVRVYKSWTDTEGRVADETEEFDSIWNNDNDSLVVYDFMDALESELIERVNHSGIYTKPNKYEMRKYQEDAKNNWITNGNKGFFVMATGTGKTITALNAIKELICDTPVFTVIAVPYKHLVTQWLEDAREFFPDAYIQCVFGEIKDAETKIYTYYKESQKQYKPVIVITTIKSFFIEKYRSLYNKIDYEKLLIVDEAHNFYNSMSDELSAKYIYKLGLSATPVFGHDEEKTSKLLDWFGGKVIDFPIEKAIGKYLVNYEYHPIFVHATEADEKEFLKYTQMMLSAIDPIKGIVIDEEKFTIGYRGRLRAISMAEEKIASVEQFLAKIEDKDHTIIYCSDGKMFFDNSDEQNAVEEIRHLEYVLKTINKSIENDNLHLKASKFTASENVDERMRLIDCFNKGYINYLVAIRCLDEGINIPSIKSALILSSNDNFREFVQRRGRILRQYTDPITNKKKEKSDIFDVIVLPSIDNKQFAEIEFRRFYEYSRLSLKSKDLMKVLEEKLDEYNMTVDDILFKNDYAYGGDLDE